MVMTESIRENSCVKARDRKSGNFIGLVSLADVNSEVVNIVIEFLDTNKREWLENTDIAPPKSSISHAIEFGNILIVITVLIIDNELLIKPLHDGFQVFHQNTRFSLNRKDVEYSYEAYG